MYMRTTTVLFIQSEQHYSTSAYTNDNMLLNTIQLHNSRMH